MADIASRPSVYVLCGDMIQVISASNMHQLHVNTMTRAVKCCWLDLGLSRLDQSEDVDKSDNVEI